MTTLIQARAAISIAQSCNTKAAWKAAALAFADLAAAAKPRKAATGEAKHKGKKPIHHVAAATFADGYSLRLSIGQFRGETESDALDRFRRLALASWRNNAATLAMGKAAAINSSLAFKARMEAMEAPALAACAIVVRNRDAIADHPMALAA